ncbi:hypothetical protein ABPG72_017594 [Tetrahymena utriculariae]
MNQFFQDLKEAFKEFRFTSPDIDNNTPGQRFLRGIRPIILTSTFVLIIGIMNSNNNEYKDSKKQKDEYFEEDFMQEHYSKLRAYMRPIFLRYLDLKIEQQPSEIQQSLPIQQVQQESPKK